MTIPINIRPVRSGDWNQFESLIAGICSYHGDTHGLDRHSFDTLAVGDNAPVIALVAETEGGILTGFVAGHPVFHFHEGVTAFEIQNLYVAEEFRRNRIGEVLMLAIMQQARRKHAATTFKIGALNWNRAAIAFYKQLGFDESTRAKDTVRLFRDCA